MSQCLTITTISDLSSTFYHILSSHRLLHFINCLGLKWLLWSCLQSEVDVQFSLQSFWKAGVRNGGSGFFPFSNFFLIVSSTFDNYLHIPAAFSSPADKPQHTCLLPVPPGTLSACFLLSQCAQSLLCHLVPVTASIPSPNASSLDLISHSFW